MGSVRKGIGRFGVLNMVILKCLKRVKGTNATGWVSFFDSKLQILIRTLIVNIDHVHKKGNFQGNQN